MNKAQKLLLTSLALMGMMLPVSADIYLSYPFTENVIYAYDGVTLDHNCHVGAAIKVTKDMYKDYIGATVKSIQVGWASPNCTGKATAFFRTDLADAASTFATSAATTIKYNGGSSYMTSTWSTIKLTQAVTLTDSLGDFYVGYTTDIKANEYCLSTLYPHDMAGSCYLWRDEEGYNYDEEGREIWDDLCSTGALALRLVATLPNLPRRAMISALTTPAIVKAGAETNATLTLTNKGSDVIKNFTLTYTLGDSTWSKRITLSSNLASSQSVKITVPVYGIGSGEVTATISKVNGLKNNYESEKKFRLLSIPENVSQQYTRRSLVEFFESESSYYVPNHYENYFYPQYQQYKDRCSLVAHHTSDQFMTGNDEEAKMLTDYYGGDSTQISIPCEMRDRSIQGVYSVLSLEYPVLGITMPNYALQLYDEALARPTCASIAVTKACVDAASEKVEVTVKGDIAEEVMGDEHLYVTVYLLEDSVETESQEQSELEVGHYIHQNLIRNRLTPMYGTKIENLSGAYEMTFTGTYNPEWVANNMRVVAVLNRGMENGYKYANVMNCAETPVEEGHLVADTTLTLQQHTVALEVAKSTTLEAKILPADAAVQNLTWKSLDEAVATVNKDGKVTALAVGTARICVSTTVGTILTDTCLVNVYEHIAQYGYAPQNPAEEDVSGYGSGKNNLVQVGICLSPKDDPMFARLKGSKLLGVRVYMRSDYDQREKGWSKVEALSAQPESTLASTSTSFKAGWNEVTFAEPLTIGDDDIYLTAQVLEEFGEKSYPFCIFAGSSMPFYAKAGANDWQTVDTQGVLLMQAIVAAEASQFKNAAIVSFSDAPQIVNPGSNFDVNLYVHNMTAEPITALTFTLTDDDDFAKDFDIDFETPLEAYGGRSFTYYLTAGTKEALNIPYTATVTTVNGHAAAATMPCTRQINVMSDAYERIPLVEEFTSQRCTACPQMTYYLDQDKEQWYSENRKLLYVTHHAGFAQDAFTKDVDTQLLYLFNSTETYNPGIMFDRRLFKDHDSPVMGTTIDYYDAMTAVAAVAGMAKVNVELSQSPFSETEGYQVRVYGEVNKDVAETYNKLYLSCYVVEDSLRLEQYPQLGLDAEGAPSDLKEKFRHNGIIRLNLTQADLGDELTLEKGDKYTFDVTFDPVELDLKTWNWQNCDIVAFVHLIDKTRMNENFILNAGSMKYTEGYDGIIDADVDADVDADSVLYNLAGMRVGKTYKGIVIKNGKKILQFSNSLILEQ